ncbi:hypothetical protein D9756_010500 [Leucocoprinus leucothites]|uniref:Uncharacterized protein n=1 Tax=Leucocoprinus leucothites TaxID=201217 RepID=A0A8H5CW79_9AGAR|nr:hypothetical protein D9756_010500 [Leucoagaricus leucothites]
MSKPTAQDVLRKIEAIRPQITVLTLSSTSFQGASPEQGLAIHNAALVIKKAVDLITPDVVNVQRPVAVPDAKQILKVLKDIQLDVNTTSKELISKKGLFDKIPAANLTALIRQDIKEVHTAFNSLADALVDAAPTEIVEEAKTTRKEYDETIKKALAVYQ